MNWSIVQRGPVWGRILSKLLLSNFSTYIIFFGSITDLLIAFLKSFSNFQNLLTSKLYTLLAMCFTLNLSTNQKGGIHLSTDANLECNDNS